MGLHRYPVARCADINADGMAKQLAFSRAYRRAHHCRRRFPDHARFFMSACPAGRGWEAEELPKSYEKVALAQSERPQAAIIFIVKCACEGWFLLKKNAAADGTRHLREFGQRHVRVSRIHVDHHIANSLVGLQVLRGDVDVVVGKHLVDF